MAQTKEIKAQRYTALPIANIFVSTIFETITVSLDVWTVLFFMHSDFKYFFPARRSPAPKSEGAHTPMTI